MKKCLLRCLLSQARFVLHKGGRGFRFRFTGPPFLKFAFQKKGGGTHLTASCPLWTCTVNLEFWKYHACYISHSGLYLIFSQHWNGSWHSFHLNNKYLSKITWQYSLSMSSWSSTFSESGSLFYKTTYFSEYKTKFSNVDIYTLL